MYMYMYVCMYIHLHIYVIYLKSLQSVMAHYRALGGAYSFALEPYYECNLTQYLLDPISTAPGGLFDYEDPYRKN